MIRVRDVASEHLHRICTSWWLETLILHYWRPLLLWGRKIYQLGLRTDYKSSCIFMWGYQVVCSGLSGSVNTLSLPTSHRVAVRYKPDNNFVNGYIASYLFPVNNSTVSHVARITSIYNQLCERLFTCITNGSRYLLQLLWSLQAKAHGNRVWTRVEQGSIFSPGLTCDISQILDPTRPIPLLPYGSRVVPS